MNVAMQNVTKNMARCYTKNVL